MSLGSPKAKRISRKNQSATRLEHFRQEITEDYHLIPLEQLCASLETDPDLGLTQNAAKTVLKTTGPNVLTPPRKKSELTKFIASLFYGFSALLWLGAFICFTSAAIEYFLLSKSEIDTDNIVLGLVLIVVVIITGTFMYYQERKSQKIMESFASMVPAKAKVIRDGGVIIINSKDVVVGDLVEIQFGDRVPADLRLIYCQNLKVDHSAINGESKPLPRDSTAARDNILETENLAFFSTSVVEGVGRGIVVACGDQTVIGHIAGLTARLKPNKSPLSRELDRFMKIISVWSITLGVVLGTTSLIIGHELIDTLLFTLGMIVANVPEGLVATVIVSLTVTAKRMASENCLIKKLDSVETLGCTSVICSDKTGTLTQNRMTVCHVWYSSKEFEVNYKESRDPTSDLGFRELFRCATLCTRAEFFPGQEKKPVLQRQVRGDSSEAAIFKYVEHFHYLGRNYRAKTAKLVEIPFSSATKYQISVHAIDNNSKCLVVIKGAPEVILDRCTSIVYSETTERMTTAYLNKCHAACMNFAKQGERVLGFADLELDSSYSPMHHFKIDPPNFPLRGFRFLGFLSLTDPPRPEVPEAIRKCQSAGIKVAMVTGDHPITARTIASKVGIISSTSIKEFKTVKTLRQASSLTQVEKTVLPDAVIIHGSVLRDMLPQELETIVTRHHQVVFARTSPTQKLQIVEAYQNLGEIVAVTGDGVNDAPALKKADIGIAMGIVGTEVAQEAADILLLDDNFASIVSGIEEGRRIFDNLKKSITYTLSSNVPEIIPFLVHTFAGIPLPLGFIGILCIDLLTDMMPAISLAYERAEIDVMSRPPRNPQKERLVNRKLYFLAYGNLGLIETLGLFFVYFSVMAEYGFMPHTLIGLTDSWSSPNINLTDYYGRTWTHPQRLFVEETCSTASMMSVIVSQWANLIGCKTRVNSIVKQGMHNMVLNASLVIETVIICTLSYAPHMYYLTFFPLKPRWWLYAIPFSVFLLLYDEFRKSHIRRYPKGWYQRETFY